MEKMESLMIFKSFKEFYPYYLGQHTNENCRRLHFVGTCAVIALLLLFFFTGDLLVLGLVPVVGYGFPWAGHFLFENNHPLSFKYPFYSLGGDFRMFWDILRGKVKAF
jgi:hypothetical protein